MTKIPAPLCESLTHALFNLMHAGYYGFLGRIKILTFFESFEELPACNSQAVFKDLLFFESELRSYWTAVSSNHFDKIKVPSQIWERFADLKQQLEQTIVVAEALANIDQQQFGSDQFPVTLGLLMQSLYSQEQYARELQNFHTANEREQEAMYWQERLMYLELDIERLHDYCTCYANGGPYSPEVMKAIFASSRVLESAFRCQLHDFRQVEALFKGNFDYAAAGFSKQTAARWEATGIPAEQAGYWAAYKISPEEAVEWGKFGIDSPSFAGIWKLQGFDAHSAMPWIEKGLSPQETIETLQGELQQIQSGDDTISSKVLIH